MTNVTEEKVASEDLRIEYVDITTIKSPSYNPRHWDTAAENNLRKSLEEHGFSDPVLLNSAKSRRNIIIGGSFRTHVAKKMGITRVPAIYLNIPDIEKEKALNLRLNRVNGDWSYELLREFDTSFLLETGFDDGDLSSIWDSELEINDDEFQVEREIKKIVEPKTKLGDKYILGRHVLICNDSSDLAVVAELTKAKEVSMLYLDANYNINLDYNNGISTAGKYGGKVDDNRSPEDYKAFLKKVISNGLTLAKEDVHVFEWSDQCGTSVVQDIFRELGIKNRRTLIWIKNNFSMTPRVAFNKATESCCYGTIGSPYLSNSDKNLNEILNKSVGSGNNAVDEIMDMLDIWIAKRVTGKDYTHPCEKPLDLLEKPIRRCTKINDVILDLFCGSGVSIIACEQMKRRCLAVEISPVFCDLIVKRWETLTGEKAQLIRK